MLALLRNECNNLEPPSPLPIIPIHPCPFAQHNRNPSTQSHNHTADTNVRRELLPDTGLPEHTKAVVGKQGQMKELEEEKRKGRRREQRDCYPSSNQPFQGLSRRRMCMYSFIGGLLGVGH